MSEKNTTARTCEICDITTTFTSEPMDAKGKRTWREFGFHYEDEYFTDIDICPECHKKVLGNKAIGRIAAIIRKSIEGVQS